MHKKGLLERVKRKQESSTSDLLFVSSYSYSECLLQATLVFEIFPSIYNKTDLFYHCF